jgi:hypothetical protein
MNGKIAACTVCISKEYETSWKSEWLVQDVTSFAVRCVHVLRKQGNIFILIQNRNTKHFNKLYIFHKPSHSKES